MSWLVYVKGLPKWLFSSKRPPLKLFKVWIYVPNSNQFEIHNKCIYKKDMHACSKGGKKIADIIFLLLQSGNLVLFSVFVCLLLLVCICICPVMFSMDLSVCWCLRLSNMFIVHDRNAFLFLLMVSNSLFDVYVYCVLTDDIYSFIWNAYFVFCEMMYLVNFPSCICWCMFTGVFCYLA